MRSTSFVSTAVFVLGVIAAAPHAGGALQAPAGTLKPDVTQKPDQTQKPDGTQAARPQRTEAWFFSNYGECFTGSVKVESPEEFAAYDPKLNELISRVFNTHRIPMDVFHGRRIRPVNCSGS